MLKKAELVVPDLIYDIRIHDGEGTAYYLHKGYRVVAIDADPGKLRFWLHKHNRVWSSFRWNPEWAEADCGSIDVAGVPFREILEKYGVPYYLKVDIEGADELCLRDRDASDLPQYISFEAGPTLFYGACFLASLGYNAFKLVDQTTHENPNTNYSNERYLQRWKRQLVGWKWAVTKKFGLDTSFVAKVWRAGRKWTLRPVPKQLRRKRVGALVGIVPGPLVKNHRVHWRPWEEEA